MEGTAPSRQIKLGWIKWLAVVLIAVIVVAYIDGGEEPLRPISQTVESPGNM